MNEPRSKFVHGRPQVRMPILGISAEQDEQWLKIWETYWTYGATWMLGVIFGMALLAYFVR